MRYRSVLIVLMAVVAGCARTPTPVAVPPIPDDIGWQVPQVTQPPIERPFVPEPVPPAPWEYVVSEQERGVVQARVPVNGVLTLQFRSDEQIVEAPLGDRSPLPESESEPPWSVKIGEAGTKYPLLHVRVTRPALTTSLTVTTTKRLYVVDLKSVKASKVRVVRWPDDPATLQRPAPRLLPDPLAPAKYHRGYRICPGDAGCESSKPEPVWRPLTVLDNGQKTYMFFPRNLAVMTGPMIRLVGASGPEVTNARLIASVMVLDHLINQAELRLGRGPAAEIVMITRLEARTIQCPGDPACPAWPALALAR
jgi:type IV secretory pathway VirB9-like protein